MKNIILKAKTEDKGFESSNPQIVTTIKKEKKVVAKIYNPNKYHKDFLIEMNTLAFYRDTLEDSLEFVRESYEGRIQAFGSDANVNMEII